MGWARNYVTLMTGQQVRYSFVQREGTGIFFVRFRSRDGGRLEKSTGALKRYYAL